MNSHEWIKKPVHWEDEEYHYISFVFSWDLWKWCQTAQPELSGKKIKVGGPAVILNPEWIPSWIEVGDYIPDALERHYIVATRTTTGCIRRCPFCAVPRIEGEFRELDNWRQGNVLIDNNLLAASRKHFEKVIDFLKQFPWCDFTQGLDSRLLTKWHVEKISELKNPRIRLAWDNTNYEKKFEVALELFNRGGIPKNAITVYVLIGFHDNPDDALYRLRKVSLSGYTVFPMRFQPLDSKIKNEYVCETWTNDELNRYMKYWSNTRFFSNILFEDFDYNRYRKRGIA